MKTKQNKSLERLGKKGWFEVIVRNIASSYGFSIDLQDNFGQVSAAPDTWESPKAFFFFLNIFIEV